MCLAYFTKYNHLQFYPFHYGCRDFTLLMTDSLHCVVSSSIGLLLDTWVDSLTWRLRILLQETRNANRGLLDVLPRKAGVGSPFLFPDNLHMDTPICTPTNNKGVSTFVYNSHSNYSEAIFPSGVD